MRCGSSDIHRKTARSLWQKKKKQKTKWSKYHEARGVQTNDPSVWAAKIMEAYGYSRPMPRVYRGDYYIIFYIIMIRVSPQNDIYFWWWSRRIHFVFTKKRNAYAARNDIEGCTVYERKDMEWMKAGTWKLTEFRREWDKGSRTECLGKEDAEHILLRCPGTEIWRTIFRLKVA
jgi:hypothetical protein